MPVEVKFIKKDNNKDYIYCDIKIMENVYYTAGRRRMIPSGNHPPSRQV